MEKKWYRLDNAAKIFPVTKKSMWTNNFRVSVTLNEKIEPERLQKALEMTLPRFPNFSLTMKKGLFWYYLEHREGCPQVSEDAANPLRRFKTNKNRFLFRVRYYERRIALEMFHVIADGNSSMLFLKTLAANYLRLGGVDIPNTHGILDVYEKPSDEEMEDSYQKYATMRVNKPRKERKAYHPKGMELKYNEIKIITGQINLRKLSEKTKEYNVTMTEFLCALLVQCFLNRQEREGIRRKKPVKICIPVNLRSFYPSKTFRNFVLYTNPGVDPAYGTYTFEEIVKQVHHYMGLNINEKNMNAMMSTNISSERNPFLKVLPLFIKNFGMLVAYRMYGESLTTCTFSNIGKMSLPDEMMPYVERFDFILNRQRNNAHAVSAVGFKDKLNITFTSKLADSEVERDFFTSLVKMGIPVKIESNKNYEGE